MKVLIVGIGLQGKAALQYLASSKDVHEIVAADGDLARAKSAAARFGGKKVKCVKVNAQDRAALGKLMASGVDAVIDLLPVYFAETMATLAVDAGVHLVNTVYCTERIHRLDKTAARRGIAILPEFGFDPGIDLVMCAKALSELDKVDTFYCYGGGFPEPKACDNPLNYKITWTFDGVLRSYIRAARILKNGKTVNVPATEMFAPGNIHTITVGKLGALEAAPNGNAVKYKEAFGLGPEVKNMGRFVLRWPGHCAFWKKLVDLRFLDEDPVRVNSALVKPRDFLCKLLEPQLQYRDDERDIVLVRVDVSGLRNGRKIRIVYELMDYRDLDSGLMAMNRTVGYTAAIGATMILRGDIARRGVLSPAKDVRYALLRDKLKECGMRISRRELPR